MNASNDDRDSCFNVTFGSAVGRLKLGVHINDVLEMFSNEYPRLQLELTFCDEEDLAAADIRVNVPQWGVRLRFQPLSQTLYFIDIHNFDVAISFNVNGYIIRGQEQTTTFNHLQKALGPSFPGKFIDDGQYLLTFDGVGFLFRIPTEFQSLYEDGKALPIVLPDKSSAVLERIYVFARDFDVGNPKAYPDVLPPTARIVLQEHDNSLLGTHFHLLSPAVHSTSTSSGRPEAAKEGCLALGMTPQDVVSNLGTPDFASLSPQHVETFIHKFEYKRLGIELYFTKNTHLVFRIVAHMNLVQHQDFGRFRRCGFMMSHSSGECMAACQTCKGYILTNDYEERAAGDEEEGDDTSDDDNDTEKEPVSGKKKKKKKRSKDGTVAALNGSSGDNVDKDDTPCIGAATPWKEARALLAQWFPRISESGGRDKDSAASNQHAAIKPVPAGCPFPASNLFAYPLLNVMFEVVEGGGISSVTVLDQRLIDR